jgi:antitoxin CptB
MDRASYLRKLHFRAHHRGTREADAIVGGFFDNYHDQWTDADFAWFEDLLEEQDVDIMGWAMRTLPVPSKWEGPMLDLLMRLDYISLPSGLTKAD